MSTYCYTRALLLGLAAGMLGAATCPGADPVAAASLNPFDAAYRQRIRSLCEQYEWAATQRRRILAGCERWMAMSDTELRRAVPSQMVPRSLYLNRKAGCPTCGDKIFRSGYYPWRMDPVAHPWKVQCPLCEERFPKNDFAAYYLSGLDEHDMFVPERADPSLLFNVDHPDPADPLHAYAVDPGTGYNDPEKGSFKFVANYNLHTNWGAGARYPGSSHSIPSAAVGLGYAYAVSGDPAYAHKAAVLLDRLAEVYPELDFEYWARQGGYHQYRGIYGTAVDSTWSTRVAYDLARGYALVRDALQPALRRKIEVAILRETFEKQKQSIIWGNTGFNKETAIMLLQAAEDQSLREDIAAWLFSNAEGEPIPSPHSDWRRTRPGAGLGRIVADLPSDGISWEGGFGYSAILPLFLTRAYPSLEAVAALSGEPTTQITMALLRRRVSAFYRSSFQLVCLDRFMPVWGDGGRFATPMLAKGVLPDNLFAAFAAFEDPELARMYWRMVRDKDLPKGDILDPHTDYEAVKTQLLNRRDDDEPATRSTYNLPGRGFSVMRSGTGEFERSLVAYYGSNSGHNHLESPNLYLFAYGMDLLPGLGYPDISNRLWRAGFWDKPISHNTVATEWDVGPEPSRLADQKLFVVSPLAALTEIDARGLYPRLQQFSRMPVLVTVSDESFYVLDFFRVGGPGDHVYSFHSGVGDVHLDGADFVPQEGGSYAGSDVPFAVKQEGEGWRIGGGLQFFRNVSRAVMTGPVSAEWQLAAKGTQAPFGDRVRLRFTLLSPQCEVAMAQSQPPQTHPDNPEWIHYILARTQTTRDEAVLYTAVIEPHLEAQRCVSSLRQLSIANGNDLDAAIEVTLADGRRDLIVQSAAADRLLEVEGGVRFNGRFLLARFAADGRLNNLLAVRPTRVQIGDAFARDYQAAARATIEQVDLDAPEDSTITVNAPIAIPEDALLPLWTDIFPSPDSNGNYPVQTIEPRGNTSVIHVGPRSFISGYDQESGQFRYAFEPGATLEIPFSYYWSR